MEDKKAFIMEKGLCFACLERGHRSKFCKNRKTCKICSKQHPTPLHGDMRNVQVVQKSDINKVSISNPKFGISHLSSTDSGSKCSLIVPVWLSHQDNAELEKLALLDTQSDTTFIPEEACQSLGVDGPSVSFLLSTMTAENQLVSSKKINGLIVRGHTNELGIALPATYTRDVMPSNRNHIPTPEMAKQWPHLEQIADKLLPLADCEIALLIGYNSSQALVPRDVIVAGNDEPYGQKTDLGWGIVGVVQANTEESSIDPIGVSHRVLTYCVPLEVRRLICDDGTVARDILKNVSLSLRTSIKEVLDPSLITRIMELDFNDGNKSGSVPFSQEDCKFMDILKKGIHVRTDNHYEMPLPFKKTEPSLPNNKHMAIHRLMMLERRFNNNKRYKNDYVVFMEQMLRNGFAEKVPKSEVDGTRGQVWYIPHHAVYHPKKPEKIRVVFDCSAKLSGHSLNDLLLQGPDLNNGLLGILCRFRQERVAFMCDVEQMFHQFKVNKDHRDFLCFLWWENGDCAHSPVEYRMTVHLFGAVSSPGCANFAMKPIANESEFGSNAANFVRRNFYVDDGLKSTTSSEAAIRLIKISQAMCAKGGLRLHKFVFNSKEVIEAISPDDRATGIKDLCLLYDTLPVERVLGVHWCVESDSFQFRKVLKDQPLTRRGVLSTVCSTYDPLGFAAPVILLGKQILQSLCREKADWDSPLPEALVPLWEQWRQDLFHLETLKGVAMFEAPSFWRCKTCRTSPFL